MVRYLDAPRSYEDSTKSSPLHYPKKKELAKVAEDLYGRLFPNESIKLVHEAEESSEESTAKKSRTEELNGILATGQKDVVCSTNLLAKIRREMTFLEATSEVPSILNHLKKVLESLLPSSVEAERCFSAAGLYITKLRSRLSDEMIDSLCFMRAQLLKKN